MAGVRSLLMHQIIAASAEDTSDAEVELEGSPWVVTEVAAA